jgi:carbamoyl-phosphate synthase large subunit
MNQFQLTMFSRKDFTILITCVGGELGPQQIQMLKNGRHSGVKIIGVDADPKALGAHFCDHFLLTPRGDKPGYTQAILNILESHPVNLVIPTSDEEAIALSSSKKIIEQQGRILACMDYETLECLSNKAETYKQLTLQGIHVPDWEEISLFDQLEPTVREFLKRHDEIVVKPLNARGGRGVYIVSQSIQGITRFPDRREIHCDLDSFLNELVNSVQLDLPVMVMERLREPVYDLDLLAWKGQSKRIVARRRVNSAVPNEGHIIVDNHELLDLGEQIIRTFQLSWLYDCDVMYDKDGNPCVLEVNPRQSGSVSVSVAAGVPLLDDLISLAKKEPIPAISFPVGQRVLPYKALKMIFNSNNLSTGSDSSNST